MIDLTLEDILGDIVEVFENTSNALAKLKISSCNFEDTCYSMNSIVSLLKSCIKLNSLSVNSIHITEINEMSLLSELKLHKKLEWMELKFWDFNNNDDQKILFFDGDTLSCRPLID